MKTFFTILLVFFISIAYSQVPQFEWTSNLEYVGYIREISITTDSAENVLITGYFSGWHDFNPGPADLLIESSNVDIFILKLDSNGDLLWARTLGGLGHDEAMSIVTDTSGNVYVSGKIDNVTDMDPGPGVYNITPTSQERGFLLCLDQNGNFNWANILPGFNSLIDLNQIAYDTSGSILITSSFSSVLDFDPGPAVYNVPQTNGTYLLNISTTGTFNWVKIFEGGGLLPNGVATNISGDIFISGNLYTGTLDADPSAGTFFLNNGGTETNGCVIKLNSAGDFIWAKSFGGLSEDEINSIDVDNNGNIYLAGTFDGTTDLDPGPTVQSYVSNGGDADPFILKLDVNGDYLWSHTFAGVGAFWKSYVTSDQAGDLYIVGTFSDTVDIDPGIGVTMMEQSYSNQMVDNLDIYIAKISSIGNLIWAKTYGGELIDMGYSITVAEPSGNVYATGRYRGTVDFNPGFGNAIYTSVGAEDGLNIKFSQCYQATPVPDLASLSDSTYQCSITSMIPPSATEYCTGTIIGVPDVTFPITTIGTTTVTWTYDAGNGFVSSQSQDIIIIDTEAPIPDILNLSDITFECSTSFLTEPSASDNCSGLVTITNNATFPITSNTIVTWTYDDGNGNSSTQDQNIVITPIDNGITQVDGITLSADPNGYSYQWVDCDNGNTPIIGETGQVFSATINGNYAVEISNGTCTVSSTCININQVSINEFKLSRILIYPNPTSGKIYLESTQDFEALEIEVQNALGQIILSETVLSDSGAIITLKGNEGIYFISISKNGSVIIREKVIKVL